MSKNKFLFCGLMAFALGLGVVTESVNSNVVAKADGEVNLGTLVVNSVNGSEGANGFYISMKSTNALPFDPGWSYTSFTSSMILPKALLTIVVDISR